MGRFKRHVSNSLGTTTDARKAITDPSFAKCYSC